MKKFRAALVFGLIALSSAPAAATWWDYDNDNNCGIWCQWTNNSYDWN